jgi:hypothetical protein
MAPISGNILFEKWEPPAQFQGRRFDRFNLGPCE